MGRASSSKKVARAASTGGGRTSRGRTPWLWYGTMSVVVVLGVLGVVFSRADLDQAAADPPVIGKDHWHTGYGVYVCNEFVPISSQGDRFGIHTHGDGLIHIEPSSALSAGKNAKLGLFMEALDIKLTSTSLDLPDRDVLRNGSKCQGKPGKVKVVEWETPDAETSTTVKGNPNDVRLKQSLLVTIAFVADGVDVPKPPSASEVPDAQEPATPMPSVTTPGSSPATTATSAPPATPATTTAQP